MTMSYGGTAEGPPKERFLPSILHIFAHLSSPSFCFYQVTSPQLDTWEANPQIPQEEEKPPPPLGMATHQTLPQPRSNGERAIQLVLLQKPSSPSLSAAHLGTQTKAPNLASGGSTHPTPRSPAWLEKTWLETPYGSGESQGSAKEALEMKSIQEKVQGETET